MQETSLVAPEGVDAQVMLSTAEVVMRLEGLEKTFHPSRHTQVSVLRGVDLEVHRGEVIAMIGPSGSGKSTTLRCINLLERPDSGRIWIDDRLVFEAAGGAVSREPDRREMRELRRRVGMVFQGFHLFPSMTVLENIVMPQVRSLGRGKQAATERAHDLLTKVGLAEKANAKPASLSGGQQQRVAIARALALDPEIMLFDEPTSAIDPELRIEVLRVMRRLADAGMTMIVVTHELGFARQVADRVVFFDAGEIVECDSPTEVLDRPKHARVRAFVAAVAGELEPEPIDEPEQYP
jgi:polar amino acid transport system ATP-binding protein